MDISAFASSQLQLISAEQQAEVIQQTALITSLPPTSLQRHGLALLNLTPSAQRTGLGGRTLLELEPDVSLTSDGKLPAHGIRSGDIVRVEEQPSGSVKKKEKTELKANGVEGVVHRVSDSKLTIAVNPSKSGSGAGSDDDSGLDSLLSNTKRLWVVKLANDVTYKRMEKTMKVLNEVGGGDGGVNPLVRVLFGLGKPTPLRSGWEKEEVKWFDEGLNESQRKAVMFALAAHDVALIHGPPGTGKTQSIIELILQLTIPHPSPPGQPPARPKRILVCGPSNISVDNIILRLPPSLPIVRLGHPARLLPRVVERSLDVLSQTSEGGEIVGDVRRELDAKLGQLLRGGKTRLKGRERKEGWDDVRQLRGEYRRREVKCVRDLVAGSKVVLSTLHGAGGKQLYGEKFDVVIIDEASQALEAQCWIPLLAGVGKVILAGDHLQLPPTVKSKTQPTSSKPTPEKKKDDDGDNDDDDDATEAQPTNSKPEKKFRIPTTLETTLFSRLLTLHGPSVKRLLTTQYRMHESIMAFPSTELYESKLIAADSVKHRLLKDLEYGVKDTEDTSVPVLFIDTQGGEFPEKSDNNNNNNSETKKKKLQEMAESKSNPLEAALAVNHVKLLLEAGVKEEDIAVITPYNAQLSLLSAALRESHPRLELGSVDGFQGREKEAVVLSLVRSNDAREVGFLKEKRRLNVAMTRSRRHLCVIGDSETVESAGGFLKRWMEWLEKEADVRYPDVSEIISGL